MQNLVWSVAEYGCESWTFKAADSKKINAFEMDIYDKNKTNNSIL